MEKNTMLTRKLKEHVTCYSLQLENIENGDSLTVGGELISVFNLLEQTGKLEDVDFMGEFEPVFITLDDGLGIINAFMPYALFINSFEEEQIMIGDTVLLDGRCFILDTKHTDSYGVLHEKRAKEIKVAVTNVKKIT